MSNTLKIPKIPFKIQVVPRISTPFQNSSTSRIVKIAKKIKGSNSIDESIEKDFLFENGDPLNFLNPKVDKYENLGYIKLDNFSNKRKSLSNNLTTDKNQKVSISRQSFEISKNSTSKTSIFKDKPIQETLKIDSHALISKEKSQKKIQEKLSKYIKNKINDKPFLSQRERSLQRFNLIKNKWNNIENGLMLKVNKQHKELLNNKRKLDLEKITSKLPSWITTLRSDPKEPQFHEFIPVGNKLSGIFVRDIIKNAHLLNRKTNSCPDLKELID